MPILSLLIPLLGSILQASPSHAARLPVRWIADPEFPITSLEQCEDWRRTRAVPLGADRRLELSFSDGRPSITCTTVDEWIRASAAGGYAHTTFDLTMECHFQNAAVWYVQLPRLESSARTSFPPTKVGLGDRRLELLRSSLPATGGPARGGVELDGNGWGFRSQGDERWEWFSPVGLGDWDGDGWEDLLGMHGCGYTEGSGRSYAPILFAQRKSGRLIDLSDRLLPESATAAEISAARARWLDSCGLPEGQEITLAGTMTLDDDRLLPITMRVTIEDGYVDGTYRDDRAGHPIPLEGTFGTGASVRIEEFPDGPIQTAAFDLEWRREGDRLSLEGHWYRRGELEGRDVRLAGKIPDRTAPAERSD